jgi:hypothetical protein
MNRFYVVSKDEQEVNNEFEIRNFGDKIAHPRVSATGSSINIDKVFKPATDNDYDKKFRELIYLIKPIFKVIQLLDFHLENYNGSKDEFISQIKYVILPKIKPSYKKIIEDWLEMKKPNTESINYNISMSNINAPVQIQQKSDNATQTQNITYCAEDIKELFSRIQADINNFDVQIREDFEMNYAIKKIEKGNDIKPQLLSLGSLITNVGLPVFTSLTSSGLFEVLKPLFGIK